MEEEPVDIRIVVFDDDQGGESYFGPLEQAPYSNIKLDYRSLTERDVVEVISETIEERKGNLPDLVLIDHILNKTSSASKHLIPKGVVIVPMLRAHWPSCPLLAITAEPDDCKKDIGASIYEEIFDRKHIRELASYIPSVVSGYRKLSKSEDVESLLQLLGVPDEEIPVFGDALPVECKQNIGSARFVHALFRWFRQVLYATPGFLYDRKWVAMTLGMKEKAIDSYLPQISNASYEGIWAEPKAPRWWKARIYSTILERGNAPCNQPIQKTACELMDVEKVDICLCSVCGDKWPETMAVPDEPTPLDQAEPVHLRCSEVHPQATIRPFFEEARIMLGD